MIKAIPHIVQYQGSKRKLAPQILQYMPKKFDRLVEPFSGTAAISIASAYEDRASSYLINDLNAPLVDLLKQSIENPTLLLKEYSVVWNEQFTYCDGHIQHYYHIREQFNNGKQTPANMLYLLARCVKGAVRYGKDGKFNQSPDKRRHGTTPRTLEQNILPISYMLNGKTTFFSLDYRDIFDMVKPGDLVYLDPPYQGVCNVKDNRYCSGVSFDSFVDSIEILNRKGVDYLISYDGECGGKSYGSELPESLGCKKMMLNAGLSSQAILLGKKFTTYEALYLSPSLKALTFPTPQQLTLLEEFA